MSCDFKERLQKAVKETEAVVYEYLPACDGRGGPVSGSEGQKRIFRKTEKAVPVEKGEELWDLQISSAEKILVKWQKTA